MKNAFFQSEYRAQMSNRSQTLSPIFRATIEAIEQHIHEAIVSETYLDPREIDVNTRLLSKPLVSYFVTNYLAGIVRLSVAALMVVPDVETLCRYVIAPVVDLMPFSDLSPLLSVEHVRVIFRRTQYSSATMLILDTITRAVRKNTVEMDVAWSNYMSRYRLDIVDLWLNHPNLRVAESATELLATFVAKGLQRNTSEFQELFSQLLWNRPSRGTANSLFQFILDETNPQPTALRTAPEPPLMNTKQPGQALIPGCVYQSTYGPHWYPTVYYTLRMETTPRRDPLTALGRLPLLLEKLLPVNPVCVITSDLLRITLTASHPTRSFFNFRAKVLARLLYQVFLLPNRTPSVTALLSIIDHTVADGLIGGRTAVQKGIGLFLLDQRDDRVANAVEFEVWADGVLYAETS